MLPAAFGVAAVFVSNTWFLTASAACVATGLVMTTMFIAYTLRASAVPKEKTALWIGLLIFGSIVVLPIFWFCYVREKGKKLGQGA